MAQLDLTAELAEFKEILKPREPLAPYTLLKIGGPAEVLLQPRSQAELVSIVRKCLAKQIPLHVLGGGGNILVRDEGVKGAVLRLRELAFRQITVQQHRLKAGCGANLADLIAVAARHGLAGLETLVGIPGTVGGALRHREAEIFSDVGQFVRQVEVLDGTGSIQIRDRDDLRFTFRTSSLEDPVFLAGEFELESDAPETIVKRMRKAWIQRKATQPFSFQAAAWIFKNPPGLNAAALIEQTSLVGTHVGGAQVSDRHPNFIVAQPGTSARDVLRLIELIKSRVQERFHVELETDISIW